MIFHRTAGQSSRRARGLQDHRRLRWQCGWWRGRSVPARHQRKDIQACKLNDVLRVVVVRCRYAVRLDELADFGNHVFAGKIAATQPARHANLKTPQHRAESVRHPTFPPRFGRKSRGCFGFLFVHLRLAVFRRRWGSQLPFDWWQNRPPPNRKAGKCWYSIFDSRL